MTASSATVRIRAYYTVDFSTFTLGSNGGTVYIYYYNTSGTGTSASQIYNSTFTVNTNNTVRLSASNGADNFNFAGWYNTVPNSSNFSNSKAETERGFTFTPANGSTYYWYALFCCTDACGALIRSYRTTNFSSFSNSSSGGLINGSYLNAGVYSGQGGDEETIDSVHWISIASGQIAIYARVQVMAIPKDGYIFYGWYFGEAPSSSNYQNAKVSDDLTYTFIPHDEGVELRKSFYLYALFVPTYELTINYSSGNYTNSTNINITTDRETLISSSSIGLNGSTVINSYGSGTFIVTISTSNTNYDYYIGTSSSATTVNTYQYSWSASSTARTINIYVYQRYTISYNANGGSGTMDDSYRRYGYIVVIATNEFTRSGYSFVGWATSSNGSVTYESGDAYSENADITLYAVWERVYEITYHSNYPSGTNRTFIQSKPDGESVNILTISSCGFSTPSGYTFEGWATTSTGSVRYDAGDTYSTNADEDLYAVWERESYNLTINFAYNYGTYNVSLSVSTNRGTLSSSSMSEGGSVTLTSDGTTSTHTVTIRETSPSPNYFYVGTSTTPTSLTSYSYSWTPTSNKSINIYTEQRYSITYNGNGNTGGSTSTTYYRYGTGTIANCGYTRTGYDFAGWATSSSGGVVYDYGDTVRNSYLTLYAVWTPKIITVNLNKNEGSGGTSTIYLKYNSGWYSNSSCTNSITSITKPTRTGWTFNGYKESANGTGTTLIDADGNITASKTFYYTSGTKTIYAVWLANNQAYYDDEGGYWYVEIGNMPQSKVDDALKTTLSSNWASLVAGDSYYFAGMTLTSKVYNNEEYCEYNGEYYLVEPIKWRLTYSSNQTSGYGTTDDTLAIMATIVYVGQYSDVEINAGAGYSSLAVTGVLNNISETGYFVSETKSMPTFGTTSLNGTAESVASNIFVASSEEIEEVAGSGKIGFSDLVKAYLLASGKDNLYFTSDLGTNYNNIFCMNGNGDKVQYKAQNYFGVQFSVLVSEYACV